MTVSPTLLHQTQRDACAVLILDNPPVNGLGLALRTALAAAIDAANADPAIHAIILSGANGLFSGGADIREFNTPKMLAEPNLHSLIQLVEQSAKPVVAAISGTCMGGGLELSLACHYRVATPDAEVGLPEVKIGLLPGAGGTQRLPRAVGLEVALNMIVSGTAVAAKLLAKTRLFDRVAEGDVVDTAIALIQEQRTLGAKPKLLRDERVRHPEAEAFLGFVRTSVKSMSGPFPAPLKCVEAVAASLKLPFEQGLANEKQLFTELMFGPESRALRHFFFGERAAAKIPDVPEDTPLRPVSRIGIIGAGTMGGGIAMNFLNAGLPVTLLEMKQEALDRGIATIRKNYESALKKGKLSAEKLEQRTALLTPSLSYDDLADADLIIEAVFEDIGVKQQVFEKLDAIAKPGAILASNTSTLDLNAIAAFTQRPQDVVGLHFFSPANVMKLLEVVRGSATAKDVLATVMKLAKKIKKIAVVSGVCDGFIGNRMVEQYGRQALYLVEEGASPQQVDRALEKFGMAMGLFRMSDLAGNDIGWAIRKRRYIEQPDMLYPRIADKLCELGRFGQKTGKGWYRYEAGAREAIVDPEVDALITAHRAELGITPRAISDEEIVSRCILALVNEGARILDEGIAARASDIDMVYITGYGFPVHKGGPMLYADGLGLYSVLRTLRSYAAHSHGDRGFWQPAALIERLVSNAQSFNG